MTEEIKKFKIPLLANQEIYRTYDGIIGSNNTTILYSSTQNKNHEEGVGFIVNEATVPCVRSFVTINERICFIQIVGCQSVLNIVTCMF